jgi:V8-like Glu-specific endopeptidase
VIASDNADVVVSYIMGLEARFVGQLKYSTMAGPGDSGSLLWDRDSLTVVGMHVGADAAHGYGNHITKVLAALGVALV